MANSRKLLLNSNGQIDTVRKTVDYPIRRRAPDGGLQMQLPAHLTQFLIDHQCDGKKLLLGLSGGLDSCVLLHLLLAAREKVPFDLHAVHVHHGLSPHADDWADFCQRLCADARIPLDIHRITIPKDTGKGIEAAAREARYQILLNQPADYVVLAHHRDDQAETVLLQLLRGAGAKGLAAMAQADGHMLRPLLDVGREQLETYAADAGLVWVEDESNLNTHYDRNFIRHDVLPMLESRFPAARHSLARSASLMAETAGLLDSLARIDAEQAISEDRLCLNHLHQLDRLRGNNLLRWWLSSRLTYPPSHALLQEIRQQLLTAKTDAKVLIILPGEAYAVRRYQDKAYLVATIEDTPFLGAKWRGESRLDLPHGELLFDKMEGQGLAIERLGIVSLDIKARLGGERFKFSNHRPTRTLKHILQEAHMPPWQRETLPLLYWNDVLAVVPGIGTAVEMQAGPDEIGLNVTWQPSA